MSVNQGLKEIKRQGRGFTSFYDFKSGGVGGAYKNLFFKGLVSAIPYDRERIMWGNSEQLIRPMYKQAWLNSTKSNLVLKLRDRSLGLREFRRTIFNLSGWFADEVFRHYFSSKVNTVQTFSDDKVVDSLPALDNKVYFITILRAALLPSLAGAAAYNELSGKNLSDFILADMKRVETTGENGSTSVSIKNNPIIGYTENNKSVVQDNFIMPRTLEDTLKNIQKGVSPESKPKFVFYDPMLATMKTLSTTIGMFKRTLMREYDYSVNNSDIIVMGLFGVNPLSTDSQSKQIYDKTGKKDDIGLGMFLRSDELKGIKVYVLTLDDHLNEIFYIVPGLGDAGDRCFGDEKNMLNIAQLLSKDDYLIPRKDVFSRFFRLMSNRSVDLPNGMRIPF